MGLAADLQDVLHAQLGCHVAWLPIGNTFALGDYGVFSSGVFTRLGSVREFGGTFEVRESPPTSLDFVSADTQVKSFAAGLEVGVIPEGAVDAKLEIAFGRSRSLLLKARSVRVEEIEAVAKLMDRVGEHKGWQGGYKLVTRLWRAERAAILCTKTSNTTVTLGGAAPALEKFRLGNVSADLRFASSHELGLRLLGQSGVVGLGLVKRGVFGGTRYLDEGGGAEPEAVEPSATLPEDDL